MNTITDSLRYNALQVLRDFERDAAGTCKYLDITSPAKFKSATMIVHQDKHVKDSKEKRTIYKKLHRHINNCYSDHQILFKQNATETSVLILREVRIFVKDRLRNMTERRAGLPGSKEKMLVRILLSNVPTVDRVTTILSLIKDKKAAYRVTSELIERLNKPLNIRSRQNTLTGQQVRQMEKIVNILNGRESENRNVDEIRREDVSKKRRDELKQRGQKISAAFKNDKAIKTNPEEIVRAMVYELRHAFRASSTTDRQWCTKWIQSCVGKACDDDESKCDKNRLVKLFSGVNSLLNESPRLARYFQHVLAEFSYLVWYVEALAPRKPNVKYLRALSRYAIALENRNK